MTGRSITVLMLPALVAVLGLYILPILMQLASTIDLSDLQYWNTGNRIFNANVLKVFMATFRVSLIVTLITVALAYAMAYFIVFWSGRWHFALLFLITVSLWLSVLVRVVGLIYILQPNGLINSALMGMGIISSALPLIRNETGVIIGMVHYMLPIAILPIYSNMVGLDRNIIRSAYSLGATDARILRSIVLPLTRVGILTSLFVCFVFCLGFYVTPSILGGGRSVMIAEYITLLIQQTLEWSAAGILSVALVLVLCLFGGIAHIVSRRIK